MAVGGDGEGSLSLPPTACCLLVKACTPSSRSHTRFSSAPLLTAQASPACAESSTPDTSAPGPPCHCNRSRTSTCPDAVSKTPSHFPHPAQKTPTPTPPKYRHTCSDNR